MIPVKIEDGTSETVRQHVFPGYQVLTEGSQEMRRIERRQKELFEKFASTPEYKESYLGVQFTVTPGVFPPRADSIVLAQNIDLPPNGKVLDVGTGSGVLSYWAGRRLGWDKGAFGGKIVATDVCPDALTTATRNMRLRFGKACKGRFRAQQVEECFPDEECEFDVILANLPFRLRRAEEFEAKDPHRSFVKRTMWDLDGTARNSLLQHGKKWLTPGGQLLMTVASFDDTYAIMALVEKYKWSWKVVGLREWYPAEAPDQPGFGIVAAVACLALRPAN